MRDAEARKLLREPRQWAVQRREPDPARLEMPPRDGGGAQSCAGSEDPLQRTGAAVPEDAAPEIAPPEGKDDVAPGILRCALRLRLRASRARGRRRPRA